MNFYELASCSKMYNERPIITDLTFLFAYNLSF
jgi:hypothetical protein